MSKFEIIKRIRIRIMLIFISILFLLIFVFTIAMFFLSPGEISPVLDVKGNKVNGGLAEKVFININGSRQGMIIKSRNIENPVLLFLHGGPAMPEYFLNKNYPSGLENIFTVCWWDQRGAGLSYNSEEADETITMEQLIDDAKEVSKYLIKRFGKEKIYLMGHSWGSFLGIQVIAEAPELYNAYIGVAQIANQLESEKIAYRYMVSKSEQF